MKIFKSIFLALLTVTLSGCGTEQRSGLATPSPTATTILISLDGFRYDYIEKHGAENLKNLAASGVRAKKTFPVFPSKTFPNHISLATGKYPNKHGIINNTFYDNLIHASYTKGRGATESHWMQAIPIWTLAELNNVKTATYYWPETEARIQGITPSYYYHYNKKTPYMKRMEQLIDWLKLPESKRPKLLISYFSLVDTMGGDYGPDSKQTRYAVKYVDVLIGMLVERVNKEIDFPVNFVIVSDHGMTTIYSKDTVVYPELDDYKGFDVFNGGTQLMLYAQGSPSDKSTANAIERQVKALEEKAQGRYQVFTKATYPEHWHFNHPSRSPDITLNAIPPVSFRKEMAHYGIGGTHGYDAQQYDDMGGLFIANGPNFHSGMTIEPFSVVHLFPMLATLLNITPPDDIDGDSKVLSPILINSNT